MAVNNSLNTPYSIGGGASFPTNHGILTGNGTNAVSSTTLTNGQLLIGNTGSTPSAATLSGGSGITVTNGAGSISIAASTPNLTISTQSGTTYTFVIGDANTYIRTTSASAVTLTVPAFASVAYTVGTTISVIQAGAGVVTFAATGGVTINAVGLAMSAQYKGATLINYGTDTWDLLIG